MNVELREINRKVKTFVNRMLKLRLIALLSLWLLLMIRTNSWGVTNTKRTNNKRYKNSFQSVGNKVFSHELIKTRKTTGTALYSKEHETRRTKNNVFSRIIKKIPKPTELTRLRQQKPQHNTIQEEDGYDRTQRNKLLKPIIKSCLKLPLSIVHILTLKKYKRQPGQLILVRHGESTWNKNKTFTGWADDADLSTQGHREIEHAARLLLEGGYQIDLVFTSRLKRAIRSSWILLQELNEIYLPVFKSWRLNERMYGQLTGLCKIKTAKQLGHDLVQQWRSSLTARPPPVSLDSQFYPGYDRRYADLSPQDIPLTESLLDCMIRTEPLWENKIKHELKLGRNVLVVAHANTLRGLIKIIDDIGDDDIQNVGIPCGIPVIYKFNHHIKPIIQPIQNTKTAHQMHMTGLFLEKPSLLKEGLKREAEWISKMPEYNSTMIKSSRQTSITHHLEQSLFKLKAEMELSEWAKEENFEENIKEEDDGTDGNMSLLEQPFSSTQDVDLEDVEKDQNIFDEDEFKELIFNHDLTNNHDSKLQEQQQPNENQKKDFTYTTNSQSSNIIVMIRHGITEHNKLGLFTGWQDIPLSQEGIDEAKAAGKLLKKRGYQFDIVYTSWLSRAIESAWYILDSMDTLWLPLIKTWRLNERMYGKLTGLSKRMVAQKYGYRKFQNWRRGFLARPPKVSSFSPYYPGNDSRYQTYVRDVPLSLFQSIIRSWDEKQIVTHRKLPKTESLKDCMERTLPYYFHVILPQIQMYKKRVLISSSQNAIRGLLMHMCNIDKEDIMKLEIPTGVPILYDLETKRVTLLRDSDDDEIIQQHDHNNRNDLMRELSLYSNATSEPNPFMMPYVTI